MLRGPAAYWCHTNISVDPKRPATNIAKGMRIILHSLPAGAAHRLHCEQPTGSQRNRANPCFSHGPILDHLRQRSGKTFPTLSKGICLDYCETDSCVGNIFILSITTRL